MTPEELGRRIFGLDCTEIDLKSFNNNFPNSKKRKIERMIRE